MLTRLPSIADAAQQVRAGNLVQRDITRYCVARCVGDRTSWERWRFRLSQASDGPIAAAVAECALADLRAKQADERQFVGWLHGVEVGVKDVIDVAGWPTEAASPLLAGNIAAEDSPIVALLRQHGALILGKTTTCQFACFDPAPTRNPWNLDRTPGGSSAGSAAAVAMEQCQLAIGTQTGGSITRPASYCGIAGFKPAFDERWLAGVIPVSSRLDHVGLIARRVSDLAFVWRVIRDAAQLNSPTRQTQPPRIGLMKEYFWEQSSEEVRSVTAAAIDQLTRHGAQFSDVMLPPGWPEVHHAHRLIMAVDAARYHQARWVANPQAYLPNLTELIREGLAVDERDYQAALEFQRMFRQHLLVHYADVDVLLTPATHTTAPGRETTGSPRFNSPWSFAGVATANLPAGLAKDGLPCGLQLIGPHSLSLTDELEVLRVAQWCEEALQLDLRPPLLQPLAENLVRAFGEY